MSERRALKICVFCGELNLNKINRRKILLWYLGIGTKVVMIRVLSTFLPLSMATPFSSFNQPLNQFLFPGHNICLFRNEKKL